PGPWPGPSPLHARPPRGGTGRPAPGQAARRHAPVGPAPGRGPGGGAARAAGLVVRLGRGAPTGVGPRAGAAVRPGDDPAPALRPLPLRAARRPPARKKKRPKAKAAVPAALPRNSAKVAAGYLNGSSLPLASPASGDTRLQKVPPGFR